MCLYCTTIYSATTLQVHASARGVCALESSSSPNKRKHTCKIMGQCLCVKQGVKTELELESSVLDGEPSAAGTDRDGEATNSAKRGSVHICGHVGLALGDLESNRKSIILCGTHYATIKSLQDEVSFLMPLGRACTDGDHYVGEIVFVNPYTQIEFGGESTVNVRKEFHIIKGQSCITVQDLGHNTSGIYELHPQCQNGNFYFVHKNEFYIIRSRDNTYMQVANMSNEGYRSSTTSQHKLHESFKNGLYYFATDNYFYVMKEHAKFGLVYNRSRDMRTDEEGKMLTVSSSIASIIRDPSGSLNQLLTANKGSYFSVV